MQESVRRLYACVNVKAMGKLPTRGTRLMKVFAVIALIVVSAFAAFPSASSSPAYAASSSTSAYADFNSWSDVVASIDTSMNEALTTYASGDTVTASSQATSAYNIGYISSNMTRAVNENVSSQANTDITTQFNTLINHTYTSGNNDQLNTDWSALKTSLDSAAQALDSNTSVANPRDYAAALKAKTKAERKKIRANSTITNEGRGSRTWTQVATEMNTILDKAYKKAINGQGQAGADQVNVAYYSYYEKLGFEKTVMSAISGSRVSAVEFQFKETRKAMVAKKSKAVIKAKVTKLKNMLTTDAAVLDGGASDNANPLVKFFTSSFGQAFVILIREGLEAILVVAAIIAYLVKAGHKDKLRYIYLGIVLGLIASGIMAVILNILYGGTGSNQEMIEGWTALVAMLMLLFTSNWMLNKSSVANWNKYIKDKTKQSLSQGSVVSLASLSFLAVFREGAETVIFYQALIGMISDNDYTELYLGAGVAAIILVIVFLLIRFTSIKIPIRPFFAITSALMAIMVVIFAGSGLHELVEADVIDGAYHSNWITNDFLGIYPYTETVAFQVLMAVVVLGLLGVSVYKQRRNAEKEI